MAQKPTISIQFPAELLARIDALAEREGRSRADVVRRLCELALTEAKRKGRAA